MKRTFWGLAPESCAQHQNMVREAGPGTKNGYGKLGPAPNTNPGSCTRHQEEGWPWKAAPSTKSWSGKLRLAPKRGTVSWARHQRRTYRKLDPAPGKVLALENCSQHQITARETAPATEHGCSELGPAPNSNPGSWTWHQEKGWPSKESCSQHQ